MEYKEVVDKITALSGRSIDDVENLLGYLFYEDEESEELMPIGQEDLESVLSSAKKITFTLLDGEDIADVTHAAALEVGLAENSKVSTLLVRFIGSGSLTLDEVHSAFSAIEFSLNEEGGAVEALMGMTVDDALKDQSIVVLVVVEE